jgi:anti-sigma factor RsiW
VVDDVTCAEVVELITAYLEGRLSGPERARLEAHLGECPGCVTYVEQMRVTVAALRTPSPDDLDGPAQDDLVRLFRDHLRGT